MTLRLDRSVRGTVLAHARDGAPEEVCGVLGGTHRNRATGTTTVATGTGATGGDSSHARTVHRVSNVASEPRTRYELDPSEQFRAMEAIEDAGGDVVGFYHSHPRGPPRPSATDEALATWDGYSYVVVSLGGPEPAVRSWRWTGEAFERERVEVVEDA
ncbi:MAG: desampylase [Haloarculaceae archaeon]